MAQLKDKIIHISLHRKDEFVKDYETFNGRHHVLSVRHNVDHLQGLEPREIAEKIFEATNAPEECLDEQDVKVKEEYSKAMDRSEADDNLKYHSVSVGDMLKIFQIKDGKIVFSYAVCQPWGWKMKHSWNTAVNA